jgi:branched-chain amino acid aminotransferase
MALVVQIDGVSTPAGEAKVSVFDRGFLYGDSVFETIRTYGARPFALAEHLARLERSAELVFIPLPVPVATLAAEVESAVAEAGNEESYVRLMITRGQGELGLDPALAEQPRRVLIVGPLKKLPQELYEQGAAVVTFRVQRPSDATPAEGAKIGNYLVAVLAMRAARQAGAQEALVVANGERVIEGASSNVFAVQGGVLITPPLEAGILPGITRDRVLRAATELGLSVRFECPTLPELLKMDEVFVCSSIRELLPVVRVDGEPIAGGEPGPLTRRLHEAFLRGARAEMGL